MLEARAAKQAYFLCIAVYLMYACVFFVVVSFHPSLYTIRSATCLEHARGPYLVEGCSLEAGGAVYLGRLVMVGT